jgi:hypothetical protein
MLRRVRWTIGLAFLGVLASCSASLPYLQTYHPVGPRVLTQPGRVQLSVTASQQEFEFDSAIAMTDIVGYVTDGLTRELKNSGMEVVNSPEAEVTQVTVEIEQMDMGYELYYWWYGVGYSSSTTLATVQLNVAVEVPGSGRRYLRRFAHYETTDAVKLWVYVIPIPFKTMTPEPQLMLRAAQQVLSQVAKGVAEIYLSEGGR